MHIASISGHRTNDALELGVRRIEVAGRHGAGKHLRMEAVGPLSKPLPIRPRAEEALVSNVHVLQELEPGVVDRWRRLADKPRAAREVIHSKRSVLLRHDGLRAACRARH